MKQGQHYVVRFPETGRSQVFGLESQIARRQRRSSCRLLNHGGTSVDAQYVVTQVRKMDCMTTGAAAQFQDCPCAGEVLLDQVMDVTRLTKVVFFRIEQIVIFRIGVESTCRELSHGAGLSRLQPPAPAERWLSRGRTGCNNPFYKGDPQSGIPPRGRGSCP